MKPEFFPERFFSIQDGYLLFSLPFCLPAVVLWFFVFQRSFHLSNSISDGFTYIISTPNCSSLLNIKNSMSPSTLYPHNVAGPHWLVLIPLKCHLEFTSAEWPNRCSNSCFPSCCSWLNILFSSCPKDKVRTFFLKLNLKLSFLLFFYFFWCEEDNKSWHFIALCQTYSFVLDFTIPGKPNLTFFKVLSYPKIFFTLRRTPLH